MSSRFASTGGDQRAVASSFFRLAQQAVAGDPVTMAQIIHPDAYAKEKPQLVGPA
jgi:hypothetical protein